jgi:hypothetical protein
MTRRMAAILSLLIFFSVVLLRLPYLGRFLTPDEQRIWTTLTAEFLLALLRGDWAASATSGYPGVTTTWAGSLGLALQWLVARPADISSLISMAEALLADPARLDMLPWLRLGVALVSAGGIVAIFLLVRRLLGDSTALLAAALITFDPFLLAHTRLLNTDPLLAIFLVIAWLALLLAYPGNAKAPAGQRASADLRRRRRYLIISGAAFGLAALTKTPALLMAPLLVFWVFWQQGHRQKSLLAVIRASAVDLAWLGAAALLTALLVWPALWAAPVATVRRVVTFSAVLSQTGHELGNYWLGQPVVGPGALFYPAVLLWRSTPVTLIGLTLAVVLLLRRDQPGARMARALLLFIVWYALAMTFSPKKFDRYLLPAFPAVDVLAAWGWIVAVNGLAQLSRGLGQRSPQAVSSQRRPASPASQAQTRRGAGPITIGMMALLLVGAQTWHALAHLPTYLTAYNPLLGGVRTAQRVMLVGWGEGLEETAAYLNNAPAAARVAAWYGHNVFAPFFHGQSFDLLYDLPTATDLYANDIDHVVTYVNQMQRGLLDPSVAAQLQAPLMSSSTRGVPLAEVYTWPKPFDHTADRELAPGLRLLGWTVGPYKASTGQMPVTLAWDTGVTNTADAPLLVTAWIKDGSGEVWATTEGVMTIGAAVPAWLDRQAMLQTLALAPPAGLLPGHYEVEMAVADGAGQSLGAITLPATPSDTALPAEVAIPSQPVVFGDTVQLAGFETQPTETGWLIDLLWNALTTPPEAQFFIHLVDGASQIVAQHDGPLPTWPAGALARQRVRLTLSADQLVAGELAVRVGLYRPATGERLPLTIGGQDVLERWYALP